MFKSISKRNLWMIAKNVTLATAVVLGFSLSAKAEDNKTYETLQTSCNPFATHSFNAQCNSADLLTEPEAEQIAQRRGRNRKSKVDGYYGGFTLGVGFGSGEIELGVVDEVDFSNPEYSTSFMGSIFEGIKFNKNISTDLEFLLVFGGVDGDSFEDAFNTLAEEAQVGGSLEIDSNYSTFALYINPRFELPFANQGKFNVYISPGIGLSQTNVNFQATSDFEGLDSNFDINSDASATGVSFQIKGGASIAITESIQIVAEARYLTLPTDDDFDNINIFGTDAGLKFNF